MDERLGSHDLSPESDAPKTEAEHQADLASLEEDQLPQVVAQELHDQDIEVPLTLTDQGKKERDAALEQLREGMRLKFGQDSTDEQRQQGEKMIGDAQATLSRLQGQMLEAVPPFPEGRKPATKPSYKRRPHWIPRDEWPDDESKSKS
jgi:hypothetical protein